MSKFAAYRPLALDEVKHDPANGQFTPNGAAGKKAERLAKHVGGSTYHAGNGQSEVNAKGGHRSEYHNALTQKNGFQFSHTTPGQHGTFHKFDHPDGHSARVSEWNAQSSGGTELEATFRPKPKMKTSKLFPGMKFEVKGYSG